MDKLIVGKEGKYNAKYYIVVQGEDIQMILLRETMKVVDVLHNGVPYLKSANFLETNIPADGNFETTGGKSIATNIIAKESGATCKIFEVCDSE